MSTGSLAVLTSPLRCRSGRGYLRRHAAFGLLSLFGLILAGAVGGCAQGRPETRGLQAEEPGEIAKRWSGWDEIGRLRSWDRWQELAALPPMDAALSAHRFGDYERAEALWLSVLRDDGARLEAASIEERRSGVAVAERLLANLYIHTDRHDEAAPLLERWIDRYEDEGRRPDAAMAEGIEALGGVIELRGDLGEAARLYQWALTIRRDLERNHPTRDAIELASVMERLAHVDAALGRRDTAAELFERAIALREETVGEYDPVLPRTLNGLAELKQNEGRYREAASHYTRALEIARVEERYDEQFIAVNLTNLASVRREMSETDGALAALREALSIEEKLHGVDHVATTATLARIASVWSDTGRLRDAELLQRRILGIRRRADGEGGPGVASTLSNLAMIRLERGDTDEAAALLQRAVSIHRVSPSGERELAAIYNNLGIVYRRRGDLDRAELAFDAALAVQERSLDRDHPEIATTLHNRADVSIARGNVDAASRSLKRALTIREQAYGRDHPRVANSLVLLGATYAEQGILDSAREYYERSIAIWRASPNGSGRVGLGEALANLALVSHDQGNRIRALALYREAIDLLVDALGPGHATVVRARYQLAMALIEGGDLEAAQVETLAGIAHHVDAARSRPALSEQLDRVAWMLIQRKAYGEAESLLHRAIDAHQDGGIPARFSLGRSLQLLAAIHLERGERTDAALLFQRSLDVLRNDLGDDHPLVARARETLEQLTGADRGAALPAATPQR